MQQKLYLAKVYLLATIVILLISQCSKKGKGKQQPKETPIVPVNGIVVKYQLLNNEIDIIGTILANEKVDLKTEVGGRITGIFFKEGQKVRQGQLLLKIYDNDLQAQLKKVELQYNLAEREFTRRKQLLDIKGISLEELEIAENQSKTLKADAEYIKAQIRKTEIISPFNGVIGLRNVSEGEIITISTLVATLQQIDPIRIEFDIPEKYSHLVKTGSIINFESNSENKVNQGKVYATEPLIDVSTRTLKIRARADNKTLSLRPGSFVKIKLLLEKNEKAIMIPSEALIPGALNQKVFIYKKGLVLSQIVNTGVRTEKAIEIKDGLQVNDTVITTGTMQLKDSVKVKLKIPQ